ncbi:MAG: hypothetical protein H6613_06585 [Ignavibacteriales bacterium]|nr:hypothetical protein [Ignavibacteriales bacterium]
MLFVLQNNISGGKNVSVGYSSLTNNKLGENNTSIGFMTDVFNEEEDLTTQLLVLKLGKEHLSTIKVGIYF